MRYRDSKLSKGDFVMNPFKLKNGESAIIRNASSSDAKKLLEYVNTICCESDFLTFGQGEFIMSVEQEESFLDHVSKQNNALYILAEIDGTIIGSLNFSGGPRPRTAHTGEFGISVLKKYWGNGIGTALINYLIEWCRQTGIIRKINLIARSDNLSAIHLYRKLGFVEEGVLTRNMQINGKFYDGLYMGYTID
jgi:RimJ/RimL family protein N-acetyltransferase